MGTKWWGKSNSFWRGWSYWLIMQEATSLQYNFFLANVISYYLILIGELIKTLKVCPFELLRPFLLALGTILFYSTPLYSTLPWELLHYEG